MLVRELTVWNTLQHPNIAILLGYAHIDISPYPVLISDWMDDGPVMAFLHQNPGIDITQLCCGIADGLAYLHSQEIVHNDITPYNILISPIGKPVLNNFSAACFADGRLENSKEDSRLVKNSARYMAPERFDFPERPGTKEADVWSFGMTVYEIVTKEQPYPLLQHDMEVLPVLQIMSHQLPKLPVRRELSKAEQGLWNSCQACWHPEPLSRPTMSVIQKAFRCRNFKDLDCYVVSAQLKRTLYTFSSGDLTGKLEQNESFPRNHGGHSDIFFGRYQDTDVAIKRVRYRLHDDLGFIKNMVRELQIWHRLKHQNVLSLLGFTVDGGIYYLSLVTEWMKNGTVLDYLKVAGSSMVNSMVLGIAHGLQYLHSHNIVHGDLKSSNVLVSPDGVPLLTDFGISHVMFSASVARPTTGVCSTLRWMSVEQFNIAEENHGILFTFKSDIWAFGMTVLELLTYEVPYAHFMNEGQVVVAISRGLLPRTPEDFGNWSSQNKRLWVLCNTCWRRDPDSRPSIEDLIPQLEHLHTEPEPESDM